MSRIWISLVALLLASCGGGGGGGGATTTSVVPQIPSGTIDLAGNISVAAFLAVDADTNDSRAVGSGGNNAQSTAQLLSNPGTVGGYVNEAGAGPAGPLKAAGDLHDFYRANLVAGQTVRVTVADYQASDPLSNDIDLLLVNVNNELEDIAAGFGPAEQLTVPYSGEFLLIVTVCADPLFEEPVDICGAGATNYVLTIGQSSGAATSSLRLSADFVPGEAVVQLRAPSASVDSNPASGDSSALSPSTKKREAQLMRLTRGERRAAARISRVANSSPPLRVKDDLQGKLDTLAQIRALIQTGEAEWAEPNYIRNALLEPSDPGYTFQWHYPMINLPAAWDFTQGDPNISVAVIDTGILSAHPDLQGQIVDGYDFVSDVSNAGDGDGPDPNPEDPGDSGTFGNSSSFHGTHVAGTVAAAVNNGGVTGVAPGVRIMPLRALGLSGGTNFDIRRAMCFAAGLRGTNDCPSDIPVNPFPVDIINMSLGGPDFSNADQRVINEVRAAGVIIVAAAGNDSSSVREYPAAYNGVIAVSAVTIEKKLAWYSSFGNFVDIAAPGGNLSTDINGDGYADGVLSTGGDDSFVIPEFVYTFQQGTSMSSPHVAGVIALMKSVNADLTPADIDTMLEQGELTDSLSTGSWSQQFGYGLVNAQKSVAAALTAGGSPPADNPSLGVSPRSLNFGATLDTLEFSLRNNAGGPLTVQYISSDQLWLAAPAANGLGNYELQVDRSNLAEGTYSGALTIVSNVNTLQLPVILQVRQLNTTGTVGALYVRLLDPVSGEIRQVSSTVDNGEYQWSVNNVPAGTYRLLAFSDADNDGVVCDSGEACGGYLTTDQPIDIDIQADRNDLDFPVSYGGAIVDPD